MSTETVTHRAGLTDLELADRMEVCWEYHRVLLVSAIEHAAKRGLAPQRWSAWTIPRDKKDWPTPAELAHRLFACRAAWIPRYLPRAEIGQGKHKDVFYVGNADGDAGRSMPIPLYRQPRVVDFAGGFAGDDLALLARAIGKGDDQQAAYREALAYFGIAPKATERKATSPRPAPPPPVEPEPDHDTNEHAQELWREAAPLCDCQLGAAYLRSHGIWRWPEPIYFHPACYFGEGRSTAPVILAPVNDPITGLVRAIWQIKLDAEGRKLWRGAYGRIPHGASSRLFDHWPGHLGIAEGLEDALALHLKTGLPCWAALTASLMADMILPDRVRTVTICQDNDPPDRNGRRAGPEAAQKLARRLRAEGRQVEIIASNTGKDANDALLKAVQ